MRGFYFCVDVKSQHLIGKRLKLRLKENEYNFEVLDEVKIQKKNGI